MMNHNNGMMVYLLTLHDNQLPVQLQTMHDLTVTELGKNNLHKFVVIGFSLDQSFKSEKLIVHPGQQQNFADMTVK